MSESTVEPVEPRKVVKSVTVGVADTTISHLTDAASLIGAPLDAKVNTAGSPAYDSTGTIDNRYPYGVTFTWYSEV